MSSSQTNSPGHATPRYVMPRYVMFDQAHNKIGQIMRDRGSPQLVTHPSWLALGLLLVAFNIIAASSA